MKKLFLAVFCLFILRFSNAQQGFEVLKDTDGKKMLKGIVTRPLLENDTAFNTYFTGGRPPSYVAEPGALAAIRQKKDSIHLIVFMGTWCEDSHFVVPRLFFLLDEAGFPSSHLSIIAADRNKKTLGNLSETLNVKNVPTIIVLKNGKEAGRIVEYGKSGQFDKELGELINSL